MFNLKNKISISTNPFIRLSSEHIFNYPTPLNLNYLYSFGSLSGIYFMLQIITGFFLAMHFHAEINTAFDSVISIMQDVENGWWLRYLHMNGASMIFIMLYLHIGRSLYYQSFVGKHATLWRSGIVIILLMMATAFIGYVLPWGQMSLWGATVITNFVTAIPYIGIKLVHWIWGGYSVNGATLTRFYSLHYMLPFIILALIFTHLVLLHQVGSTNPNQTENKDYTNFHVAFSYKDLFAFNISLFLFVYLICFNPNLLGHPDNYIPANALITPMHIVPEWYFTPFYAILRSCSSKIGGVLSMLIAIAVLFLLPTNNSFQSNYQLMSAKSKLHKCFFWLFVCIFIILIDLGNKSATFPYITISRIYTVLYFSYIGLVIMNITSWLQNCFFISKVYTLRAKQILSKVNRNSLKQKIFLIKKCFFLHYYY